jgi:hypothetical protein
LSPAETAALMVDFIKEYQVETIHSHADTRENQPSPRLFAA